jgi:deazaflavin-dependent oxidoreductase (nitroreductase family)
VATRVSKDAMPLETMFLNTLNQFAEPLVRAGLGNPLFWPTGPVVVEVTGRSSGRSYKIPLLATRVGDLLLVSTVRCRSQWLKNLAANPQARYWLAGRPHEATAFVITQGQDAPLDEMPPLARYLANLLIPQSSLFGVGFAILVPRSSANKDAIR